MTRLNNEQQKRQLLKEAFGIDDPTAKIDSQVDDRADKSAPNKAEDIPTIANPSGTRRSQNSSSLVPSGFNPTAFRELEPFVSGNQAQRPEAMLIEYDGGDRRPSTPSRAVAEGQRVWVFLLNPSALSFSTTANYNAVETLASRVPGQQYGNSSGMTLKIPATRFATFCYGKGQKSIREGLIELSKCRIEQLEYNPPLLSFVFGDVRLSPCVLTEIKIDEVAWSRGGDPADLSVSMTLLEVPNPELLEQSREVIERQFGVLSGELLAEPLTERQQEEAITEADSYIEDNLQALSENEDVADILSEETYDLSVDPDSGNVTLVSVGDDGETEEIGILGKYNGDVFTDENSEIIDRGEEEENEEDESGDSEDEDSENPQSG